MIESIKLRDFRGIKTGVIEGFRKINLLVGPNNSGKSAVLEAIYLACTASRPAGMTDEGDTERKPYDTTVAESDLFGDHPMQRIWVKHGYGSFQGGLSEWAEGEVKIHQKDRKSLLPDFILRPKGGFDKGDERFTAVFGLESADRIERDETAQLQEISERILALKRDLEAPHDERITGPTEEQEKQRDELIKSIQTELSGKEERKGALETQLRAEQESTYWQIC